jgi:ankyrin repeat protein
VVVYLCLLQGFSALHWAAVKGYPSVMQLLIDKKATIDEPSTLSGETPLLVAAR